MFSEFMISRFLPRTARGRVRLACALSAASALALVVACEKVPLLAPSGSTITLTSSATTLPVNGTTTIIAQVLEASGSAPHSGTDVTFTTTLGTIQPSEVSTDTGGRAIVTFNAGNASGTAVITALSGGASVSTANAVKILVGTAAVGRVIVSANPVLVPATGGSSTVSATVLDINGNALPSALVTFSTTSGTLSTAAASTDINGSARTILTTFASATVTASVGAQGATGGGTTPGTGTPTPTPVASSGTASGTVTVALAAAANLVITPPSTAPSAGLPASFTFAVTAAASNGSAIKDVSVNWGDGSPTQSLGAVTGNDVVSHVYQIAGTYIIVGTLTDASGNVQPVSTSVSVVPVPNPTIIITPSVPSTAGTTSTTVTFQIQVTPPVGVGILNATIFFGDGQSNGLGGLSGSASVSHPYAEPGGSGQRTVTVTVVDTLGRTTSGFASINVP
jgi:hypothetical protein